MSEPKLWWTDKMRADVADGLSLEGFEEQTMTVFCFCGMVEWEKRRLCRHAWPLQPCER